MIHHLYQLRSAPVKSTVGVQRPRPRRPDGGRRRAQLTDSVAVPSPIEEEPDEDGEGLSLPRLPAAAGSLAVGSPAALPAAARSRGFRALEAPPSPRDAAPEPRPFTPRPYQPPEAPRRSRDLDPDPEAEAAPAAAASGGTAAAAAAARAPAPADMGPPVNAGWMLPGLTFGLPAAALGAGEGGGRDADADACEGGSASPSAQSVSSVEARLHHRLSERARGCCVCCQALGCSACHHGWEHPAPGLLAKERDCFRCGMSARRRRARRATTTRWRSRPGWWPSRWTWRASPRRPGRRATRARGPSRPRRHRCASSTHSRRARRCAVRRH